MSAFPTRQNIGGSAFGGAPQPKILNRVNFPTKKRGADLALNQFAQSMAAPPPQSAPLPELASLAQPFDPALGPIPQIPTEAEPAEPGFDILGAIKGLGEFAQTPGGLGIAAALSGDPFMQEALAEQSGIAQQQQLIQKQLEKQAEAQRKKEEREFGLKTRKQELEERKAEADTVFKGKPKEYKKEYIEGVGVFDPKTGELQKELGAPSLDAKEQFKQETKIRTEYNKKTTDFRKVRDATIRLRESAKDPSAAGDLAMIFNYMKILDPGSTVREGEFATAQNSAGIPDVMRNQYNRILEGKRLAPKQRKDFLDRGNRLFIGQEKQYKRTGDEYRKLAGLYGLDASRVVLEETLPAGGAPAAPGTESDPLGIL